MSVAKLERKIAEIEESLRLPPGYREYLQFLGDEGFVRKRARSLRDDFKDEIASEFFTGLNKRVIRKLVSLGIVQIQELHLSFEVPVLTPAVIAKVNRLKDLQFRLEGHLGTLAAIARGD